MMRFLLFDFCNHSYKQYKDKIGLSKKISYSSINENILKLCHSSNIKGKSLDPHILKNFENEKLKWNKDYSKFIFPHNEDKNEEDDICDDDEKKINNLTRYQLVTFTFTAFFIGIGIYAFRRSNLVNV
jgi:hypothetical protein